MRAILFDKGLKLVSDYKMPVPAAGEALLRVRTAGVCMTDIEIMKGYMGFTGVLGHEFSAIVEECPSNDRLEGKRVVGEINVACGKCRLCRDRNPNHCPERTVVGIHGRDGAFADYMTLPVRNLHPLPDSITDEEAVFIEPIAAAYEITEQVLVSERKDVCVIGDGRLGLIAAEVLWDTGCALTVVGRHEEKLAILKKQGIRTHLGIDGLGRNYDIVADCTGSASGLNDAMSLVKPRGTIIMKTTVAERGPVDLNRLVIDEITLIGSRCGPFKTAIEALEKRVVDVAPFITKTFTLDEGLSALEYAGKKGVLKVLIKVSEKG